MRFSLTSHASGWQNGKRQGIEANAPLLVLVDVEPGPQANLPGSGSFLSVDGENLVLSTMKKCEHDDRVIVRLYDAEGKPTNGTLTFHTPVKKAEEATLLEEAGATVPSSGKRVTVQVGKNAIETLKITPAW